MVAGKEQKMSEWDLVLAAPLKLIPTMLFALCYVIGGRHEKWVRRYIGPTIFTLSCAILAQVFSQFSPKILVLLLFAPVLTLGYPNDTARLFYVLTLSVSALVAGAVFGSTLGYLQAIYTLATGIYFTIGHPEKAVNEEALIEIGSVILIPFMVIR